ncbi:hypothetical protein EVAR_13015_1 [Eumeta japonica]|uniref:Uncharacterized protein n=1 Tax=Eumeta variegata TaxID=151549 RepID=A0A4C1TXE4_EUMVA|nr:hypothetical protein EVAR_13015_1 [Eumeta japonica]
MRSADPVPRNDFLSRSRRFLSPATIIHMEAFEGSRNARLSTGILNSTPPADKIDIPPDQGHENLCQTLSLSRLCSCESISRSAMSLYRITKRKTRAKVKSGHKAPPTKTNWTMAKINMLFHSSHSHKRLSQFLRQIVTDGHVARSCGRRGRMRAGGECSGRAAAAWARGRRLHNRLQQGPRLLSAHLG